MKYEELSSAVAKKARRVDGWVGVLWYYVRGTRGAAASQAHTHCQQCTAKDKLNLCTQLER